MVRKVILMALMTVMLAVPPAFGSSMSGPTGLLNIPNADVNGLSMVGASVHVVKNEVWASLNYGIFDFLEIGAAVRSSDHKTRFSGFLKAQIFQETQRDPGMAAGIHDKDAFVVLSKALAPLMRGHIGLSTGSGVFGGFSYLLNPVVVSRPNSVQMPRVLLLAEYDGHRPNIGTRLSFAQGLDIDVALMNFRDLTIGAAWRSRF